jgi:hypothetical protein
MLRLSVLPLSALAFAALLHRSARIPDHRPNVRDTVQAGDAVVDADRLKPFSLSRQLTLTRGDSVKPFGRQSEQLTSAMLGGQPVLLDVLTFDTPNAITVDTIRARLERLWRTLPRLKRECRVATGVIGLY